MEYSTCRSKQDTSWAKKGHELAWEQFQLPIQSPAPELALAKMPELLVAEDSAKVKVESSGFSLTCEKTSGLLTSWRYQAVELIQSPLQPHFWRAPTDNDRGFQMAQKLGVWRDAGWKAREVTVHRLAPQAVRITVQAELPKVEAKYELTYTVYGSGDVVVDARFTPGNRPLPEMPRFGMQMALAKGFDTIAWFGRGPHETYCDRNDTRIGLYRGAVKDQYFGDYSEPGESGNKVDVRWAAVTNREGVGLLAVGMPLLSVNALHTTDDLQGPKHTFQIPCRDYTTLNLDRKQMGVGGDNSQRSAASRVRTRLWPRRIASASAAQQPADAYEPFESDVALRFAHSARTRIDITSREEDEEGEACLSPGGLRSVCSRLGNPLALRSGGLSRPAY